jgi:hypothetical protein
VLSLFRDEIAARRAGKREETVAHV